MSKNQNPLSQGNLDAQRAFGGVEGQEIERRLSEDFERRQRLLRFLGNAAAGDRELEKIVNDPDTVDWLLGLIEQRSDGTNQYMSAEMLATINRDRLRQLNIDQRVSDATAHATKPTTEFLQDIQSAKTNLQAAKEAEKAAGGSMLQGSSIQELDALLGGAFDERELLGRRTAFVQAVRSVIEALGRKSSAIALNEKILGQVGPYLNDAKKNELTSVLRTASSVDVATRDKVLKFLSEAAALVVFPDKAKVEAAKKAVKDEQDVLTVLKRREVTGRFPERQAFNDRFGGSDAETVVNFAIVRGNLDYPLLEAQLSALGVNIIRQTIKTESGVDDGKLPADWDTNGKPKLVAFLERSGLNNPSGISLRNIYNAVKTEVNKNPDMPASEEFKLYVKEAARIGGVAADIWWKWIKSLPRNFTNEVDLGKLIEREQALSKALKAIETIDEWRSKSDTGMNRASEDLVALQKEIDAISIAPASARTPGEHVEQSKMLLDSAKAVFKDLETGTNFPLQQNARIRKTAFYIAMTQGIPAAREFLNNPEAFSLEHTELSDPVLAFQKRVNVVEQSSGRDILKPLADSLGVKVAPYALATLAKIRNPQTGLSVTIDDLIANPAVAGVILDAITTDDPTSGKVGGKQALIQAYLTKTDVPGIVTATQAGGFVQTIHRHLSRQADDRTTVLGQLTRPEQSRDLLNVVRTAKDTLSSMLNSGDFAQQACAVALIGGGIYAIYKMWKAGGMYRNMLVGIPAFIGLDIALKKATGKGILDRLNLNFMNEKDRNSALEQFVRRSRNMEGYGDLDSAAGRESMRQLMDSKKPIPVTDLLRWRECVLANGKQDFGAGAPEQVRIGEVVSKLGVASGYNYPSKELKQRAYQMMFKSFEALCIDVASTNGLGGANLEQKAALGARLIESRYVRFDEQYLNDLGLQGDYGYFCKCRQGGQFSMADVLVFERPTPAMTDALDNASWSEYMLAKLGMSWDWTRDRMKEGYSWSETKVLNAKEKLPGAYRATKETVLSSFDSFTKWAYPAGYKIKEEVKDDVFSLYNFLTGTAKSFGLLIKEKGPGVVEWTFDKGVDVAKFTKKKAIDVWRALHRNHITGPILLGFEKFFEDLFRESVRPVETKEAANLDPSFSSRLRKQIDAVCENAPTDAQITEWLNKLKAIPSAPDSDAKTVLAQDVLKREIFSLITARRIKHIADFGKLGPLSINWNLEDFDVASGRFKVADPKVSKDYNYIRTNYNLQTVLSLAGNERTYLGMLKNYSEKDTGFLNAIAYGTWWMGDFVLMNDAAQYLANDIKTYVQPLLDKAQQEFGGKDNETYKMYEEYVNTLMCNAVFEVALEPKGKPDFRDTKLTVERAEEFLQHLFRTRGKAPEDPQVLKFFKDNDKLAQMFRLTDENIPTDSNLAIVRFDDDKKVLMEDGVPRDAKPSGAPSAAPPTTQPDVVPQEITPAIEKLREKKDPATTLDASRVLIRALRKGTDRAIEIRRAFDETIDQAERADEIGMNYLVGVSDNKRSNLETKLNVSILQPKQLEDIVKLRPNYNEYENPILQKLLDRAVVSFMKTELSKMRIRGLDSISETDIMSLYKATKPTKDDEVSDLVSHLLEYVHFRGKKPSTNDPNTEYKKFLEENGLPQPPKGRSWWGYINYPQNTADRMAGEFWSVSAKTIADAIEEKIDSLK